MVLFAKNQEVICLNAKVRTWSFELNKEILHDSGLRENTIYTVADPNVYEVNGRVYLQLKELAADELFFQSLFAPVMPSDQLEDQLSEIFYQPSTII